MPSSKKIRGRARKESKAKKAKERESGIDEDFCSLLRRFLPTSRGCMHGFINTISKDDDVSIFSILLTVAEAICTSEKKNDRVGGAFDAVTQAINAKHPSVCNDVGTIKLVAKALLGIGTQLMLDHRAGTSTRFQIDIKAKNSFRCATILAFAEYLVQHAEVNLQGSKPFFYNHKVHELICSDERRMVSYLIKRIPCSCLHAKFSMLRSEKRMSVCSNPNCAHAQVDLKILMKCERCRKAHYCSQKCQAADYEGHKLDCVGWKRWRKLKKKTKKIVPKPQDSKSQDELVDS